MVGHDLRNPLTGIKGAAYILRNALDSGDREKMREFVELIERNVEYSDRIVNDLLEYSKDIHLDLAPTNLKSVVTDALRIVKVLRKARIVTLVEDQKLRVDSQQMSRVFVNLIENAIEAMPNGGTLTIQSRKTEDDMEVAFADTGTGIEKETMEKLWTPLFTTKAKGMGLGLAISKRIVEAHNGSISVESITGKGSTFTVRLPIDSEGANVDGKKAFS